MSISYASVPPSPSSPRSLPPLLYHHSIKLLHHTITPSYHHHRSPHPSQQPKLTHRSGIVRTVSSLPISPKTASQCLVSAAHELPTKLKIPMKSWSESRVEVEYPPAGGVPGPGGRPTSPNLRPFFLSALIYLKCGPRSQVATVRAPCSWAWLREATRGFVCASPFLISFRYFTRCFCNRRFSVSGKALLPTSPQRRPPDEEVADGGVGMRFLLACEGSNAALDFLSCWHKSGGRRPHAFFPPFPLFQLGLSVTRETAR